jgi:hypothetical protein
LAVLSAVFPVPELRVSIAVTISQKTIVILQRFWENYRLVTNRLPLVVNFQWFPFCVWLTILYLHIFSLSDIPE